MSTVDYLLVFTVSFGTGMGTTLGAEAARFLIGTLRNKVKRQGNNQ